MVSERELLRFLRSSEIEIYRKQREWAYPELPRRIGYILLSAIEPRIDSEGHKRCVNCDGLISPPKRKYCTSECADQFFREHNWAAMSSHMLSKQKWTCQLCGAVPESSSKIPSWENPKSDWFYTVDHILPIALGGKEFDESNLQVLCGPCHKKKTKEDQAKIAKKRREITPCIDPFNVDLSRFDKPPMPTLENFC